MIPSLVIRRLFLILDTLLLVAVGAAGVLLAATWMQARQPLPDEPQMEDLAGGAASVPLPALGSRESYDTLAKSAMFGEAGTWDPKAAPAAPPAPPPPPEPVVEVSEETSLRLKLLGTVALTPKSPFSSAFIQNLEANDKGQTYFVGESVMENVVLDEIHPRMVKLLNKRMNPPRLETLSMEEPEIPLTAEASGKGAVVPGTQPTGPVPSAPSPNAPPEASSAETRSVKRDELIADIAANYSDLIKIQPEMAYDEQGNVLGVTAKNVGSLPLAKKLGFQENDVVQTINGERIDSQEKLMEIFERYQDATAFRIGILRNGVTRVITYRLE